MALVLWALSEYRVTIKEFRMRLCTYVDEAKNVWMLSVLYRPLEIYVV